jgi:hypothetical protein
MYYIYYLLPVHLPASTKSKFSLFNFAMYSTFLSGLLAQPEDRSFTDFLHEKTGTSVNNYFNFRIPQKN